MNLSQLENILQNLKNLEFKLPDGSFVPSHFHITEVGLTTKKFIDCGGTIRDEVRVGMQLWNADDYEHQLKPYKLLKIIELSKKKLSITDGQIEIEYQGDRTLETYSLDYDGENFVLVPQTTACLAIDQCGISSLKTLPISNACGCGPNQSC
jgi:hypothetical protein